MYNTLIAFTIKNMIIITVIVVFIIIPTIHIYEAIPGISALPCIIAVYPYNASLDLET